MAKQRSPLSLFAYINPFAFIVAFGAGLLLTYSVVPAPSVVVKFPNPYNAGKVTYRAEDNNCYKYTSEEVACPLNDPDRVRMQPI